MKKGFLCVVLISCAPLWAKDLGVHGTLFPIHETSLLDVIMTRLKLLEKQGKLEQLQKVFTRKAEERVLRPQSFSELPQTQTYGSHLYNPEFVAEKDYTDHKGVVFAHKGQKINPLDNHSWGEPLVLINGDDEDQIKWVQNQKGKIVLTQGSPITLEKQLKRVVYFDQGGLLVKKYHIISLPATISQKDKRLLVEVIPIFLHLKVPLRKLK